MWRAIGDAFHDGDREHFGMRFSEYAEQSDVGHGRTEHRQYWLDRDKALIDLLGTDWAGQALE